MDKHEANHNAHHSGSENFAPKRLVLLVTVVQKGKGTFFADFLKNFGANLQICCVGTGTAQNNLIELLGLKDNKRTIIFSIVQEEKLKSIFEALEERFYTVNNGLGISYAIPLSSVIGKLSYGFLSDNEKFVKGKGEKAE